MNRQLISKNRFYLLSHQSNNFRYFTTDTKSNDTNNNSDAKEININFIIQTGETVTCPAKVGETLLDVCLNNELDVEGACGGECCCSTCHVYLPQQFYDSLEEPDDDELDMLDLALSVSDTYVLYISVSLIYICLLVCVCVFWIVYVTHFSSIANISLQEGLTGW